MAKPTAPDRDQHPDAWERFTKAVDAAAVAGPKHKVAKRPRRKATTKKNQSRVEK